MNLAKVLPELFTSETILISIILIVIPAILGLLIATLITIFRIKKIIVLSQLASLYVSFTRSVPSVLQLFIVFYALPVIFSLAGININNMGSLTAAILGLSFYHSGYLAEVLRPAYLSVDRGQHEAAESFGFSTLSKFFKIILPQVIPVALPGWGNALIYLVHNSALVMYIGVMDVMAQAHVIMEGQFNQYQVNMYFVLALFYCTICLVLWVFVRLFEKRTEKYHLGTGIIKEVM